MIDLHEMQERIQALQTMTTRASKCKDAREVLGQDLWKAIDILDRMQYLIDREYWEQSKASR